MYRVSVLVKNLDSNSEELNFAKFKLKKITEDDDDLFQKARNVLFPGKADKCDYIYERNYTAIGSNLLSIIIKDIEDALFLLRLFKVGDLGFLSPCIHKPDGTLLRQFPYRIMTDICPFIEYEIQDDECSKFDNFVSNIMSQNNQQSWNSPWFQTARRFFLYGSSKEFNPIHNDVDRIVDYMVTMESILVPESNFIGSRLRKRAASLLRRYNICQGETEDLLKSFYNLRSKIVHGDIIFSKKNNNILDKSNVRKFEKIIRDIIIISILAMPEDDNNRKKYLKNLFDINDDDRAKKIKEDFRAIKDTEKRNEVSDFITKHIGKPLRSKTEN